VLLSAQVGYSRHNHVSSHADSILSCLSTVLNNSYSLFSCEYSIVATRSTCRANSACIQDSRLDTLFRDLVDTRRGREGLSRVL
jgi:hypothetical protein